MNVVVTGGTGFLGSVFVDKLLAKGHRVISISRHAPQLRENMVPLVGDITQPNLGLNDGNIFAVTGGKIGAFYHLAAIHHLGKDRDSLLWKTNVEGTRNVMGFCTRHVIPHLYFCSTAYTWPVNPYGMSKIRNEEDIAVFTEKHGIKATIFKPSIIMGTEGHPYPGHFSQFVSLVIKVHQRAELIRRKIEGTLRLPVLEPVFRVRGNPEGKLNLIPVDTVAQAMVDIEEEGTFWLTHPAPPTLGQLAEWLGEVIMVRMKFEPKFKTTPIEATFQKIAAPFAPYLQGDDFRSDLKECLKIDKLFICDTIKRSL